MTTTPHPIPTPLPPPLPRTATGVCHGCGVAVAPDRCLCPVCTEQGWAFAQACVAVVQAFVAALPLAREVA